MIGSLFSGVDGLALGLERATGLATAWQCEYDKDASTVLAERWPGVPNLHDIAGVDWAGVERVELLCGGPPCQPTSSAGLRKGEADERWMWPAAIDAVRHLRPRWIVFENPPALLTLDGGRPFGRILASLAQMGYVGRWGCVRASDIGAPHRRERLFLVAHAHGLAGSPGRPRQGQPSSVDKSREVERAERLRGVATAHAPSTERRDEKPAVLEASTGRTVESRERTSESVGWHDYGAAIRRWEAIHGPAPVPYDDEGWLIPAFVEWMMGFPSGWVTDAPISRSAQLRCLGNAVVPHCAAMAWHLLAPAEVAA